MIILAVSELQDLWQFERKEMKSLAKQHRENFPLLPSLSLFFGLWRGCERHQKCAWRAFLFVWHAITKLVFFVKQLLMGSRFIIARTDDRRQQDVAHLLLGSIRGQGRQEKRVPYIVSINLY